MDVIIESLKIMAIMAFGQMTHAAIYAWTGWAMPTTPGQEAIIGSLTLLSVGIVYGLCALIARV